jgi:hypothetical protein
MNSRGKGLQWFPLWVDNWLFGSTRIELTTEQRAVWVDLMALASKDSGYVRANPSISYLPTQLAGLLNISEELLKSTVQRCVETEKIEITNEGTLRLVNFDKYSLTERRKRDFSVEIDNISPKAEGVSEKAETKEEKRKIIEEKRKGTDHPFLRSPTFLKKIEEFREHRKKMKHPLTDYAVEKIIKKTADLSENDLITAIAILDQSIDNVWQGVFPLKDSEKIRTLKKVKPCKHCGFFFSVEYLRLHEPECSKHPKYRET